MKKSEVLHIMAEDTRLLEVARRTLEDVLIDYRDSHISTLRNNGLAIKNKDGTLNGLIRIPTEAAVSIALRAMAEQLQKDGE